MLFGVLPDSNKLKSNDRLGLKYTVRPGLEERARPHRNVRQYEGTKKPCPFVRHGDYLFFLLDDALFYEDLLQHLHTLLHLFFRVRRHQGEANERVLRSASRRDNGVDEHTSVEGELCH